MPDSPAVTSSPHDIGIDRYRAVLFPNRLRELRLARGRMRLMALSSLLPDIPYIRLSKIERGEVFARAAELRQIGEALGVAPAAILIDVDSPDFDIAVWARAFLDDAAHDAAAERFALLVAATLRAHRAADRSLTIAVIERDHAIAPVILSRLENAQKPIERWNAGTLSAVFDLLGVRDLDGLRALVEARHRSGALAPHLQAIAGADDRLARTRERVAALRAELGGAEPSAEARPPALTPPPLLAPPPSPPAPRLDEPAPGELAAAARQLAVIGAPLADGLIAAQPTGLTVEAPRSAGPRAFALKVFRATLGMGLPGQSMVIFDPDRYPRPGGIVAVREGDAYRLLALTIGRDGVLRGHSVAPDHEVEIDTLDPAMIATAVAAVFV